MKFFKTLRWIISLPLCLLLFIMIIIGLNSVSISSNLSNPETLKKSLDKGGVYKDLPRIVTTLIKSNQKGSELSQLPLGEKQMESLIGGVFEPNWVKKNVEKVIDSGYLFLEGKTNIPRFTIDITDRKTILITELNTQIQNTIEELPVCSPMQEAQIINNKVNPVEIGCWPSSIDKSKANQMGAQMGKQIEGQLNNNEMLKDGSFKSKDFIKIKRTEAAKIQQAYLHFKKVPLYILSLIFVLSLIIFVIVPNMTNKLKTIGFIWIISNLILLGLQMFIRTQLFNLLAQEFKKQAEFKSPERLLQLVNKPINLALQSISNQVIIYSLIMLILGIVMIILGSKTKSSQN